MNFEDKWNKKVIHEQSPEAAKIQEKTKEEIAKEAIAERDRSLKEEFLAKELKKTEQEKEIINGIQEEINKLMDELSLPHYTINADDIHIIKEEDFRKEETDQGCIYPPSFIVVPRIEDWRFQDRYIRNITHEIVHSISAFTYIIHSKVKEGQLLNEGYVKRSGVAFHTLKKTETEYKHPMAGINEAITELLAKKIVSQFYKNNKKFKGETEDFYSPVKYNYLLLREIIEDIFKNEEAIKEFNRNMFVDYIKGSYAFLKKIEKAKKGSAKVLIEMGIGLEEAARTARELGYKDLSNHMYAQEADKWSGGLV